MLDFEFHINPACTRFFSNMFIDIESVVSAHSVALLLLRPKSGTLPGPSAACSRLEGILIET